MATVIKSRIDDDIALARIERGPVHCPEDTHRVVRRLANFHAQADDYIAAFQQIKTHIERHAEEELIEAETAGRGNPGEYAPKRAMRVPASGMTVTVTPQYDTTREIDMDQVLAALAGVVWEELSDPDGIELPDLTDDEHAQVCEFAVAVAKRAVELYRTSPASVKAVQALAALAGARGDDQTASIVNGAVKETCRVYKNRCTVTIKPTE